MKLHPSLLFLALLLSGCENFFETTVKIDVPEHEPALAITSHLIYGDTSVLVFVSKSQGILDNDPTPTVSDATVELLKNGQPMGAFAEEEFGFYRLPLADPLPSDGATYELKVSAGGLSATASQTLPTPVPILSVTFEDEGTFNADGDKIDELSVEFQDPAGEDNYYALRVWVMFDSLNQYMSYYDDLDPLSEDISGGTALKDDSFEGKKYTWRVGNYNFADPGSKLQVQLISLSRDKYLFLRSRQLGEEADDNPFAEPVIIHNNIVGGYGIFSSEGASEAIIEL